MPRARKELTNLNNHSTPLGKLHCVKRVVKALSQVPKRRSAGEPQEGMYGCYCACVPHKFQDINCALVVENLRDCSHCAFAIAKVTSQIIGYW